MKRLIVLLNLVFVACTSLIAQRVDPISSGNSGSIMLGVNKKVYAWGRNSASNIPAPANGVLGVGSTAAIVTSPTLVTGFPANLTFKQVSAGGLESFYALDCEGKVWAWGANDFGQLGNGLKGGISASPVQVKAGAVAGTSFDDGSGNLKGVKFISGGLNSAFAVLTDGRVLAWGVNSVNGTFTSDGLLGDGTKVDKLTPVFVLDGSTNLPLTNVVKVESSDAAAFALVDKNKSGKGNVYSWGTNSNSILGRNAMGTLNSGSEPLFTSLVAYPVIKKDTTILSEIVDINVGIAAALALDSKGFVWSWGIGAWGGATGQGTNVTHSDPRKVVKGEVGLGDADPSGTYLLAKTIAAGMGYSLAITKSGKAVTWGNNLSGGNSSCTGGALGNGSTSILGSTFPVYVKTNATTKDSNLVYIYSGDTWGYYVNNKKEISGWGCNTLGMLGDGTTVTAYYAKKITLPVSLPPMQPISTLSKRDTTVCSQVFTDKNLVLNTSFNLDTSLQKLYTVKWYKNNVLVKSSNLADQSYIVTSVGGYKSVLKYIGADSSCFGNNPVKDSIVVGQYNSEIAQTINLTYTPSKDTVKAFVNALYPSYNPRYKWFKTQVGGVAMDTSVAKETVAFNLTNQAITKNSTNGSVQLFVEQLARKSGLIAPASAICSTTVGNIALNNNSSNTIAPATKYISQKNIVITGFKFKVKAQLFNVGTVSGNLSIVVCGAKTSSNVGYVPDLTKTYGSVVKNVSFSRPDFNSPQEFTKEITVQTDISVPAEAIFYITFGNIALSGLTGSGLINILSADCIQSNMPLKDNFSGEYIKQIGTSTAGNEDQNPKGGIFYNVTFDDRMGNCPGSRLVINVASDVVTDAADNSNLENSFELMPNPAKDQIQANVPEAGLLSIKNLNGLEVMKVAIEKGSKTISIQGIQAGYYLVEYRSSLGTKISKLVVE